MSRCQNEPVRTVFYRFIAHTNSISCVNILSFMNKLPLTKTILAHINSLQSCFLDNPYLVIKSNKQYQNIGYFELLNFFYQSERENSKISPGNFAEIEQIDSDNLMKSKTKSIFYIQDILI